MRDRCQRWRNCRDAYRPAGEPIDPRRYEVAPLDELPAREFVETHHYSRTYPAARWRFGLHRGGQLVGVAVFSHPQQDRALTNVFGGKAVESVELGRFVLLDDVPANGETWFLGQCFRELRGEGLRGVLAFSDPLPRRTSGGSVVLPGHVGTIYQAFNGRYLGRGTSRTLRLTDEGTALSPRMLQKARGRGQGWAYAVRRLVELGAEPPAAGDCPKTWVRQWVAELTRPIRHKGNHRYAWSFHKSIGRDWPELPYPKTIDQPA